MFFPDVLNTFQISPKSLMPELLLNAFQPEKKKKWIVLDSSSRFPITQTEIKKPKRKLRDRQKAASRIKEQAWSCTQHEVTQQDL